MKNILQFSISKGENNYIAQAVGFPIFTQGKTLDELTKNISEAAELYLEAAEDDSNSLNHLAKNPSLLINYEIPLSQYA